MEPLPSTEFYDRLAGAFDVMTDWPARLAFEMPFIRRTLDQHNVRSVLDTACGTGWHAIALAQKGYSAAGCDASRAMVGRARANAAKAGVNVRFETADFQRLDLFPGTFDAILCLGNSLPHLLSGEELVAAFGQILGRLDHGGLIILHNLNYDLRLKTKPRFFSASGSADTLVWRFADYGPEFITFHTALFERKVPEESTKSLPADNNPPFVKGDGGGFSQGTPEQIPLCPAFSKGDLQATTDSGISSKIVSWSVEVNSTLQRPWLSRDLDDVLTRTGFVKILNFGGLDGSPYEPDKSADLVIVALAP
jgi:glycine/sarcosine N-methyltransferase